jgi:hypothetical protein
VEIKYRSGIPATAYRTCRSILAFEVAPMRQILIAPTMETKIAHNRNPREAMPESSLFESLLLEVQTAQPKCLTEGK